MKTMKHLKYILLATACMLGFTACQDGENIKGEWDEPDFSKGAPFGNNDIKETNVITIQELLDKYPNVYEATDKNVLIEEDIQIKARVTGNSAEGNLYKQLAIQDATAGIMVCVDAADLHGYLVEGQEVLIDLKGIYIGGYGLLPEIGMPYNGNSIGRMANVIWQKHMKLVGNIDTEAIQPVDFSTIKGDKKKANRLVILKNVSFTDAGTFEDYGDGKGQAHLATFAPDVESRFITKNGKTTEEKLKVGGCVNRTLNEQPKTTFCIRTSTYANFAASPLPYDPETMKPLMCNITGIATRYKDTWQILIRKTSDIVPLYSVYTPSN